MFKFFFLILFLSTPSFSAEVKSTGTKVIKSGWYIIKTHDKFEGEHNYLIEDPIKNYKVAYVTKKSLRFSTNQWIKLKIWMECSEIESTYIVSGSKMFNMILRICNADKAVELKCNTERNSLVMKGIRYC